MVRSVHIFPSTVSPLSPPHQHGQCREAVWTRISLQWAEGRIYPPSLSRATDHCRCWRRRARRHHHLSCRRDRSSRNLCIPDRTCAGWVCWVQSGDCWPHAQSSDAGIRDAPKGSMPHRWGYGSIANRGSCRGGHDSHLAGQRGAYQTHRCR